MQSDPDLYPNNLFLGLKLLFFGFFLGGADSASPNEIWLMWLICYVTIDEQFPDPPKPWTSSFRLLKVLV